MRLPPITSIDRGQWLRLLRVTGKAPASADGSAPASADGSAPAVPEEISAAIKKAEERLLAAASPRGIYRVVTLDQVPMAGSSIARHLEGCDTAALLAVTSGSGIDDLLRTTQIRDMAMAVILDAGASVLIEQIADAAGQIIKADLEGLAAGRSDAASPFEASAPGAVPTGSSPADALRFATPRFSPGYGDYPLSVQRELLQLTDAPRRIGLTLTPGDMMTPSKSITAVIGLAGHPVSGHLATCEECTLRGKCDFMACVNR